MTIAPGIVPSEAALDEICRRYEIKELAIFGSAARGETGPESDIDLLVEFQPEASVSLFRHAAAEDALSELLGRKVVLFPSERCEARCARMFPRRNEAYLKALFQSLCNSLERGEGIESGQAVCVRRGYARLWPTRGWSMT